MSILEKLNIFKQYEKFYSPVHGRVKFLEEVPDQSFSKKLVGEGLAIDPLDDTIYMPCDGVLKKIYETNHAFYFQSSHGLEVFIHVGINSIDLRGKGFTNVIQKTDCFLPKGKAILRFDLEYMRKVLVSPWVVLVITNVERIKDLHVYHKDQEVHPSEELILKARY